MSCPFYGKHATALIGLVSTGSNQCALILDHEHGLVVQAPCVMDVELEKEPDAWACPLLKASNGTYHQMRSPSLRRQHRAGWPS